MPLFIHNFKLVYLFTVILFQSKSFNTFLVPFHHTLIFTKPLPGCSNGPGVGCADALLFPG